MTERDYLMQQIDELRSHKERLAQRAWLIEQHYNDLRADNPRDGQLAELRRQLDDLDEWHDRKSDEIGRLHARLYEVEAAISRREFLADAAYGRSL